MRSTTSFISIPTGYQKPDLFDQLFSPKKIFGKIRVTHISKSNNRAIVESHLKNQWFPTCCVVVKHRPRALTLHVVYPRSHTAALEESEGKRIHVFRRVRKRTCKALTCP